LERRIKVKSFRLLCLSLLLCLVFPILSYADQLEDANRAIESKDFIKACELLRPLAEENNAEAQFLLGTMYVKGQGVEMDVSQGLSLIMKAASQGYEEARISALSLCSNLARQGDTGAMYNMGYMCLNGWGGEQDANECIKWLETAAEYGHVRSAKVLSGIYSKGKFGITPDEEKASYWSNLPAAFADGINGEWEGTTPAGPGVQPVTLKFNLEADGNNLKGTVSSDKEMTLRRITDGKIEGNNVSFVFNSSAFDMSGKLVDYNYTGVLSGNVLILTYTSEMSDSRNRGPYMGPDRGGESVPVSFIAKRVL
jgi:hypothetical protein